MGDIESIPSVSVLQSWRVKFKYNLCVSVIQNGWVTLSPFHVLVFYKKDGWNVLLVVFYWSQLPQHNSLTICAFSNCTLNIDSPMLTRVVSSFLEALCQEISGGPWNKLSILAALKKNNLVKHTSKNLENLWKWETICAKRRKFSNFQRKW